MRSSADFWKVSGKLKIASTQWKTRLKARHSEFHNNESKKTEAELPLKVLGDKPFVPYKKKKPYNGAVSKSNSKLLRIY